MAREFHTEGKWTGSENITVWRRHIENLKTAENMVELPTKFLVSLTF